MRVTNRQFVKEWVEAVNKGAGVASVADRLGLNAKTTSIRANSLRKRGVELPHMPRVRKDDFSVEELNKLIEQKLEVNV